MSGQLKLIVEEDFHDFELLIEKKSEDEKGFYKVRGPYIVTEKKNANGNIYSIALMEKVVQQFIEKKIKSGMSFGELNHPTHTNIDPRQICHRVISLEQNNDDPNLWMGESIVLTSNPNKNIKGTPNGDILASMLQHGGRPGMSTRGVGEINEQNRVDKDYTLITIDCVTDPSGPGCFVDGILESKNFMINQHGDIVEIAYDTYENKLKNIPNKDSQKYIYEAFKQFIKDINL